MKRPLLALSRRYQAALQKHLLQGPKSRVQPAHRLGKEAVTLGLETLDLARMHKTALTALVLPGWSSTTRNRMAKRAGIFFNEAIIPVEKTHRAGIESAALLHRQNKTLNQRSVQLAASNRLLKRSLLRRKAAEAALKANGRHNAKALRESQQLQSHLQDLLHKLLSAQEVERTQISHELYDEVAQTLLGINVRLLTLKNAARGGTAKLTKEIASTHRIVEESIHTINRVAHELGIHKAAFRVPPVRTR